MRTRTTLRAVALGAATTLALAGCLSEGGDDAGGGGGGAGGDGEVEIMYGFANEQSEAFIEEVTTFADAEGINVKFSPTPDYDKLIRSRVAGNNLPDIAIFPQPGITLDIARSGKLADLRDVMDTDALSEAIVPGIMDAATDEEGAIFAAPISISVKSLVWYPKQPFEAAGYTVPTTHEELLALTDQIKADGTAPWCIGIESGPATGWPATDWVEDYVLREGGTEGYDQWVKHEIPFNDPVVVSALDRVGEIWFPEGNVLGGSDSISSQAFATAANPMFETPPGCMLHRQASFLALPGSFPDAVIADLDNVAGVFQLPPTQEGSSPVMGGGDLAGLFSQDDEDSIAILEFITSEEFSTGIEQGGFISPHKGFDLEQQPNQTMKDISEIAYTATEFRFDGSDTMPGEVGAGSFWREMVEWANGKPTEDTPTAIEESWPAS
jgi:alpha-glucoside transport system substrate-binding protein